MMGFTTSVFPTAQLTSDRFQVGKVVSVAVDRVWHEEQRECPNLNNTCCLQAAKALGERIPKQL